ncbi:MAG: hypothetical protein Tsb009_21160 [Planctomycetaceae bacterium]
MSAPIFAFFSPGPFEMMIIGVIALLLFGKRLPEVARSLGKGLVEFKKGIKGIEDDVENASYAPPESSSASRPVPEEETEAASTAPKFEPPSSEPREAASETATTAESGEKKNA